MKPLHYGRESSISRSTFLEFSIKNVYRKKFIRRTPRCKSSGPKGHKTHLSLIGWLMGTSDPSALRKRSGLNVSGSS